MPATEDPTATSLGPETLVRLSRLDAEGYPILSVYIDLDPARFPTPAARGMELGSLLDEARRQGGEEEAHRIAVWLHAGGVVMRGAAAVAIFCSTHADILEAVPLPQPVEPLAVLDSIPWLEPLAAMISPGDWGIAVLSRRGARLFRGSRHGISEFAMFDDELHRRHSQGGWAQARYQRHIEGQAAAHVRRAAEYLFRAHQRRPFEHVVIVCSGELQPLVEHDLHSDLAAVLSGFVDADLEHATAQQIAEAITAAIERAEHAQERELIAEIEQSLGTGGPAAAGLDEVLSMLEQQRVATLLVPDRSTLRAGICPTCGRLSTVDDLTCPLDGATLNEVDAIEHAVDEAARQSVRVVVIRDQTEWLREHDEIACVLRW